MISPSSDGGSRLAAGWFGGCGGPEVTCRVTRETPVGQGFHCFRGWAFWLLQGQWDGYAEEFEGSALGWCGFGEGGHGGAGGVVAVAQVDPGQGSQVVQQGGEA